MHGIPDWKYKVIRPTGIQDDFLISMSTREVLVEALKYGITWEEIVGTRIIELNYNGKIKHFYAQVPSDASHLGFNSCLDKSVTRGLLLRADISIPHGYHLTRTATKEYWLEVFDALQKPLVVKPTHGNQGKSVFMNIRDKEEYLTTVQACFDFSNDSKHAVIVEETSEGTEYRILATREKVVGIINRIPANVIGDGEHTVQQLIDIKNTDPRRSDNSEDPLCKILIDEHVERHLEETGVTLDTVPAAGERIFLRTNSNISTGGDSIDVTDIAHPTVKEISLRVMAAIPGLEFAGIDFMTKDITAPQSKETYSLIEVNGSPGFNIHDYPYEGQNRHAAREFLFLIYPELKDLPLPE